MKKLLMFCLIITLPFTVFAMDKMSDQELEKVTGMFADVAGVAGFMTRPISEVVPIAGLTGWAAAPAVEAYFWYNNSPTVTEPIKMVTDTAAFTGAVRSGSLGFGGF